MKTLRRLGAAIAARVWAIAGSENRAAVILLLVGFSITIGALIFFRFVAGEIAESETQQWDEGVLRRIAEWREHAKTVEIAQGLTLGGAADVFFRDITALGGPAALTLLTIFTTIYLALCGRREEAYLTIVAAVGAIVVNTLLKQYFERPRPVVVEHAQVYTSSFPSGHSMASMAIYLTLGIMLARLAPTWTGRAFATASTVFMALLIASSRMYEGVHYLTDVSAGASLGLAWALSVLCADEVFRQRRHRLGRAGPPAPAEDHAAPQPEGSPR